MRKPRRLSLLVGVVLLGGCSLAPDYQRPAAPVPADWNSATPAAARPGDWQAFIADARLRGLIEQALNDNRSLRQTLLDVEAARAAYGVQRAERLPHLALEGEGTRQRLPADVRAPGTPAVQENYRAGLGLSAFELDLFGRVRNLSEAALQEYLASEEAARSARISLIAEVVRVYLGRDGAQQRLQLAQQTLAARQDGLRLVAQRRQVGYASELDYQEALAALQDVMVQVERIARERRQADNALALLVGGPVASLPDSADGATLQVRELAPGVSSQLLEQRPDIRAAEHRLQGRNASIGAARAAFFPRISLTGAYGSSSAELSDLFSGGQRSWSFMPQLSLPLFDGGRNAANLDLAEVRRDQAVAAYEERIQVAFREVADALAAGDTLRREELAQRALAQTSATRLRLAQARYDNGTDDYLRLLDAQRDDLAARLALVQAQVDRQQALTELFRALGGDWQVPPRS